MSFDPRGSIGRYIEGIGAQVTSDDIDTYARLEQLTTRAAEQRSERILRLTYGWALLILLSVEIVAVLAIAFLIGFDVIELDRWVATTFIGGTFTQVSGLAFLIVRYLFPVRSGGNTNDQS